MLTKERCDECITIFNGRIFWRSAGDVISFARGGDCTPDEAELFAYRLLDAVKRARQQCN